MFKKNIILLADYHAHSFLITRITQKPPCAHSDHAYFQWQFVECILNWQTNTILWILWISNSLTVWILTSVTALLSLPLQQLWTTTSFLSLECLCHNKTVCLRLLLVLRLLMFLDHNSELNVQNIIFCHQGKQVSLNILYELTLDSRIIMLLVVRF